MRMVGRVEETAHLRELVRRAVAGQGCVVLIEGEPGAGKSTMLGVAAAEARRLGVRVLRDGGVQKDRPMPFSAVSSWLDVELAIAAAGTGAADRDFLVTEALLDRVDAWCSAAPLMLLVDDLQWADPSSLLLLGRLGRTAGQLPLLLAVAYQPPSPAAPAQSGPSRPAATAVEPPPTGLLAPHLLAEPAAASPELDTLLRSLRGRGAVSITLAPLSEDDLATLVETLVGAPPGPWLRNALAGAGGNPMYALEVLGALARTGWIAVSDGVATLRRGRKPPPRAVPDTLVELIRRRLAALTEPSLEVLRAAAVLGPDVDLTDLAAVLGTPVISLWQPVSEAVAAGLLTDSDGHLVFRHDLVRQTLADDLGRDAAAALQQQAGQALAAAGAPIERVAQHLVAGTGPELPPDLLDWLVRSASTLVARAPELAVELLGRALGQDPAADGLRFEYARALLWAGQPADAQRAIRVALSVRDGGADGAGETTLRWLLAQAYLQRGHVEEALAEAEDVLLTGGLASAEEGRFHGFVAQCLLLSGQIDAADAAAARAEVDGRAGTDGYATAYGLSVHAGVQLLRGRPAEALDLADRALAALGGRPIQPDRQFAPHLVRGLCLLDLDRPVEAAAACEEGRAQSEHGGRAFLTWHHMALARVRYLDGRWDDALAEIEAGLDAIDCLGVTEGLRSQAALIALHRGDDLAAGPYADVLAYRDASLAGRHWGLLRLSAQALGWERDGKPDRALETLLDAWERRRQPTYLAPDLARLAAITGQRAQVRKVADALDRIAAHHPAANLRGAAALCRGVATADPELLIEATTAFAAAGRPLQEGHGYEEAAAVLADAGQSGEARAALDAAIDRYERLDAAWDLERAQARLRRAGVRHRHVKQRPKTGWEALTETERRVAALVAEGRSNPDIAAKLYLSRRTVRNHVSHILAKLGLSSRVELAVRAYEHSAE
jgi:DNA-binding NarL/FixJ family response regulator/tetratricopeptide (TPR) repeat protein